MSTPPPSDRRIDADELIAVVVALAAIGGILAWGLRRMDPMFSWATLDPAATRAPDVSPSPRLPLLTEPTPLAVPPQDIDTPAPAAVDPGVEPDAVRPERVPVESPRLRTDATPAPDVDPTPAAIAPDAPSSPAPVPRFSDVPTDYWAYPFIAGLASQGIIEGLQDGTFQPEGATTRAQFASALQDTFELGTYREGMSFSDISADYAASPAIDAAVRSTFMNGYPDQTFKPDQPISRLEMFLSLFSGMQLPPPEDPQAVLSVYPDAASIPEYAIPAIAAVTQANLVVLPPGQTQLQPNQPATRAEVASTLYQARVFQNAAEPVSSEAVVTP